MPVIGGAMPVIATWDFSTGVSMSAVTKGQLIRGKSGFAGEVGHRPSIPTGRRAAAVTAAASRPS